LKMYKIKGMYFAHMFSYMVTILHTKVSYIFTYT